MLDSLPAVLQLCAEPRAVVTIMIGVGAGLLFGILPGLSGLSALAILLPFIYGMDPMTGLGFLLASHAAVYTGGSVSAVLLGIPGAPANAATVADGYALQQQGQGTYAVGAALTASALGGFVSAVALMALLPLLKPVVLAFGAPEIFLLALLGLACIAVLGQGEPRKGLVAAGLGLFLTVFGYHRITGVPRFWLGSDYLLDGIRLIPLVLGLFSIPEIIDMARAPARNQQQTKAGETWRQLRRGTAAVLRRPWLFCQSVLIGMLVGIVPGVGGETAPFLAHGAAMRRRQSAAGIMGRIEGVIAPESCNNAKEGGALVPTLALGIPGSAGMALLMGGFIVLGLEPGPDFLESHMDIANGLAFILAVTNLLSALVMAPFVTIVARLAAVRGQVLAPALLVLVVVGAYAAGNNNLDVLWVFAFGALGLAMKRQNYSRPALILGFVLGPIIETYLHISLQAYGAGFVGRPISLGLILLLAASLIFSLATKRAGRPPRETRIPAGPTAPTIALRFLPLTIAGGMIAVLLIGWLGYGYGRLAMLFPLVTGAITCLFCLLLVITPGNGGRRHDMARVNAMEATPRRDLLDLLGLLTIIPFLMIFGYVLGAGLYLAAFLKLRGERWQLAAALGAGAMFFSHGLLVKLLRLSLPAGLLGW